MISISDVSGDNVVEHPGDTLRLPSGSVPTVIYEALPAFYLLIALFGLLAPGLWLKYLAVGVLAGALVVIIRGRLQTRSRVSAGIGQSDLEARVVENCDVSKLQSWPVTRMRNKG